MDGCVMRAWAGHQEGRCHAKLADGKSDSVSSRFGKKNLAAIIILYSISLKNNVILISLGAKQFQV